MTQRRFKDAFLSHTSVEVQDNLMDRLLYIIKITYTMKVAFVFLLMGSLFIQTQALAQEQADTTINLTGALSLGVSRYPSIKAKMAQKQASISDVSATKARYIPKLVLQEQVIYSSANGMTGTFWPNEGYALPTSGAVRNQQNWSGAFGQYTTLALNGPITSFGKLERQVNASTLKSEEADYAYQNEIFQHKIKITDAYLRLLIFQEFVGVQQSNLDRAIDLKNAIDSRVNSGLRPGVDSANVHAEVSKAKMNLMNAQRQEQSANIALAELTGLEGKTLKTDPMDFTSSLPPMLGENDQIDFLQNPMLKYARAKWETAAGLSDAARVSWRPTLSFMVAGIARGSGISNSSDTYSTNFAQGVAFSRYNYLVGVHLLWNVLDFTKMKHEYHALKSESDAMKFDYEQTRMSINRELQDSKLQLNVALQQAHEAPVQLRAARSAFNQASARYNSGLGTLPELSENMLLLSRAEADLAIAYNNVWRSVLGVAAASGNIDLFMNQLKSK